MSMRHGLSSHGSKHLFTSTASHPHPRNMMVGHQRGGWRL